jgi:hypothetical protein
VLNRDPACRTTPRHPIRLSTLRQLSLHTCGRICAVLCRRSIDDDGRHVSVKEFVRAKSRTTRTKIIWDGYGFRRSVRECVRRSVGRARRSTTLSSFAVTGQNWRHLAHRQWRRMESTTVAVSKTTRPTAAQKGHTVGMSNFNGP